MLVVVVAEMKKLIKMAARSVSKERAESTTETEELTGGWEEGNKLNNLVSLNPTAQEDRGRGVRTTGMRLAKKATRK